MISANYTFSYHQHITESLNIYSYGCVSLLAPICCVSLCVLLKKSTISTKSTIKKPHVSDLGEFENFEKMMNNIGASEN